MVSRRAYTAQIETQQQTENAPLTQSAIAQTALPGSSEAGAAIAAQIAAKMSNSHPNALIVFASPAYDHRLLLEVISRRCEPGVLVGCTTAGEFANTSSFSSSVVGIAFSSNDMEFSASLAHGLSGNRAAAAEHLAGSLTGGGSHHPFRYGLLLADALAGHTEDLLERLAQMTPGYQFFGGGAGDDDRFAQTRVFCGTEVASNAVVLLEILSKKRVGIGVGHGWIPATPEMHVSESSGNIIVRIDARPAAEIYEDFAKGINEPFNRKEPLPFFLHHIIGIKTHEGYRLRVPLTLSGDGSIICAAEVPAEATVCIMKTDTRSAVKAALNAANQAVGQLGENTPALGLFFDCAATRLRMGGEFGYELEAVARQLNGAPFGGCNTYGQIVRATGQFSGFHNCTAVMCVLPE